MIEKLKSNKKLLIICIVVIVILAILAIVIMNTNAGSGDPVRDECQRLAESYVGREYEVSYLTEDNGIYTFNVNDKVKGNLVGVVVVDSATGDVYEGAVNGGLASHTAVGDFYYY